MIETEPTRVVTAIFALYCYLWAYLGDESAFGLVGYCFKKIKEKNGR